MKLLREKLVRKLLFADFFIITMIFIAVIFIWFRDTGGDDYEKNLAIKTATIWASLLIVAAPLRLMLIWRKIRKLGYSVDDFHDLDEQDKLRHL